MLEGCTNTTAVRVRLVSIPDIQVLPRSLARSHRDETKLVAAFEAFSLSLSLSAYVESGN